MKPFVPPSTLVTSFGASPLSSSPYADDADHVRHARLIEQLASEIDLPVKDIVPLYEDILAQMRDTAKIDDYLPLLVCKRVKRLLNK